MLGAGGGERKKLQQLPHKVTPALQGSKGFGEGFLSSVCGCWDCLELCPGALSCLSPAALFIEPPGDGRLNGNILLSGTDMSRCSCETCTEEFSLLLNLLLLPID